MVSKQSLIDRVKALENRSFLTKKAGSFSNVPPRTVQSWAERELIVPDIANTSGTGSKRRYSLRNCIEIGIVKSLSENRLALKKVDQMMKHLKSKAVNGRSKTTSLKMDEVLAARAGYMMVRTHLDEVVGFAIHVSHFVSHQTFDVASHPEWDEMLIVDIKRIAERVVERVESDMADSGSA